MNATIILVIGAVAFLVPLSLVAAFAVSTDKRDYVRHYDAEGFSVEACNRNAKKVTNANGIMVSKPLKRPSRDDET